MRHFRVCFDEVDVVHVIGVALQVELAQSLFRAWVLKNADRTHLIPDYDSIRAQFSNSRDLILARIGIVYPLRVRTDPQPFLLPLNLHLHKNSIDPLVLPIIERQHPDLLISVLEQ